MSEILRITSNNHNEETLPNASDPNIEITRKHFSLFSSNSEASALELIENSEDMFLRYYVNSDVDTGIKSSTTH